MRLLSVLGVLCIFAAPAAAGPVDYVFDIVGGSLTVDTSPDGIASPDPVTVPLAGTFGATIDQSDCHIGESDWITLGPSMIYNAEQITIVLMNLATADIIAMDAVFSNFMQPDPAHIGPGGLAAVQTDAYFDATIYVTGLLSTTFSTSSPAGELLPFDLVISTSVMRSDVVIVNLGGIFMYEIGVSDISQTLTLDLIIDVVGTAHVIPDPAFGGLTALGLAGAGAWLRRRR